MGFFLEKDGKIVYQFPLNQFSGWQLWDDELEDFYYGDLDMDGMYDIIIIATVYAPHPLSPANHTAALFFQRESGFFNCSYFDDFVNMNVDWHDDDYYYNYGYGTRMSIDEILEFIRSQDMDWDEFFEGRYDGTQGAAW